MELQNVSCEWENGTSEGNPYWLGWFLISGSYIMLHELPFILKKYFHVVYFIITLRNTVFLIEKSMCVAWALHFIFIIGSNEYF